MNFALLGDDPGVWPFLRALASLNEHRLTHAAALASPEQILRLAPTVRLAGNWGELLDANSIDAVIVAGPDEVVLEGARQIAAAAAPLVVYPRGAEHSTLAYELQLVRDDSGAVLCPLLWRRFHPLLQSMREKARNGASGRLLHIRFERRIAAAGGSETQAAKLSPAAIDDALLHDVDLLRSLAGDFNRVTAIYSHDEEGDASLATVTLVGDETAEVFWSAQGGDDSFRLEARCENGALALTGGDDPATWRLEHADGSVEHAPPDAAVRMAEELCGQLQLQIDGASAELGWTDLIRVCEIVDAANRSRARRRTIDLNFATTSERSIFKSQMAAGGCLLLAATLLAMLVLLAAGALLDPRDRGEKRSSAVGFVVTTAEFGGGGQLTPAGRVHVESIAVRARSVPHAVLVEQDENVSQEANEMRRAAVAELLAENEVADAEIRTRLATIQGKWLSRFRTIGILVVFLPLAIFLGLQLLLLITRPSAAEKAESGEPEKGARHGAE